MMLPENTPVLEGTGEQGTLPHGSILTSFDTPVFCSRCGCIDAPAFYLRRSRGLYELLCFRNGEGCWETSPKGLCQYASSAGEVCAFLEEYQLYDMNGQVAARCCSAHLPLMLPQGNLQGFYIAPI